MEQHNGTGTMKDLVLYRIQTSRENLNSAKILYEAKEYKSSNNRAYYAIYQAINAIHALDGNAYKKHKDALANFNREYVRTEIFPRSIGRRIAEAAEIRHASDYDDFYFATASEALEQINLAEEVIEMIEKYCVGKMD